MSDIVIRRSGPDEWQTWRDLRLRALADAPEAFGQTLASVGSFGEADWRGTVAPRTDAVRFLAFVRDVPMGMCVVVGESLVADLYAMWVAPEARGLGVAGELLAASAAVARMWGARELRLHVSDPQIAARRLYERHGFVATGERGPLRDGSPIMVDTLALPMAPLVMGIVNVTPDSFTDGYPDPAAAIAHGLELVRAGADILDIGGEATNPKAQPVTVDEELRRVLPVIRALAPVCTVSIDTTKAVVATAAREAGATIINDVSGGLFDPAMFDAIGDATYIAGHLRGRSLAEVFAAEAPPDWRAVRNELAERISNLSGRIWVDPGIGFGKGADPETNADLVRHAGDIQAALGKPVVIGASRKRFLRRLAGLDVQAPDTNALDAVSVLASLAAVRAGARVIRIHNVALLNMHLSAYNKE
jgi:dihydropteroate synthase